MPSLREKKRYLVFEVISKSRLSFSELADSMMASINAFLGEFGAAKANIKLLPDKWDKEKQRGIIKVNRKYVNQLRAALCMITSIKNSKILLRSVGVSGILKKASKFMI